jgi:XTP/dITP diphosphohydrolase
MTSNNRYPQRQEAQGNRTGKGLLVPMSRTEVTHRKLTPGQIVIASHNAGKVREIRALVEPYGVVPVSAGDLGLAEPEETGTTFADNALLKAHAAAQASGLPALADDSGLCVAALGGRPGVYTADWAQRQWFEGDPGRDWYLAMGKVEGLLAEQGVDADRSAYFICTLALAWPDGHAELFEGRVHGALTWPPRGLLGFGYDPVFVAAGMTQTFAEIDPAAKHAMSHRADAFAKLVAGVL